MVASQSMSAVRGRRVRAARLTAPADRGAGPLPDPLLDLGHHLGDHRPGRLPGGLRHHRVQPDQGGDQVDVGLHGAQQLGLEQQGGQVEPLDGVPLHHLDDAGREVGPDVAQPAGDLGCRRPQPGGPVVRPRSRPAPRLLLVERGQRRVHRRLVLAQLDPEPGGRRFAEQQPPAGQPLVAGRPRPVVVAHGGPRGSGRSTSARAGAASARSYDGGSGGARSTAAGRRPAVRRSAAARAG